MLARTSIKILGIGAVVTGLAGGRALAQGSTPPASTTTAGGQELTRVEATRGDVGPLRTSARQLQPDLRVPLGFEQVYRLPGARTTPWPGGGGGGQDRFVRVNGAVSAVFPRSEYVETSKGTRADVPAGTVYYIGAVPGAPEAGMNGARPAGGGAAAAARRVDLNASPAPVLDLVTAIEPATARPPASTSRSVNDERTRTMVEPRGAIAPAPAVDVPPETVRRTELPARGMMTDEAFRRSRVRELIRAASDAQGVAAAATSPLGGTAPARPTATADKP